MPNSIHSKLFPEVDAGGFTRLDGTVQFYCRVNALLPSTPCVVLDFGAGRGVLKLSETSDFRLSLQTFKGRVKKVIGIDVDDIVRSNPFLDEAFVAEERDNLPLADNSIDIVVSDYVLEHIANPPHVAAELDRVLTPGGWICIRTPNRYGYVAIANRMMGESLKHRILHRLQPERLKEDVFKTHYLMNTSKALARYFPKYKRYTYYWESEPGYHANSQILYWIFTKLNAVTPPPMQSTLLAFMRKPSTA